MKQIPPDDYLFKMTPIWASELEVGDLYSMQEDAHAQTGTGYRCYLHRDGPRPDLDPNHVVFRIEIAEKYQHRSREKSPAQELSNLDWRNKNAVSAENPGWPD
jgi:hypothetical protein